MTTVPVQKTPSPRLKPEADPEWVPLKMPVLLDTRYHLRPRSGKSLAEPVYMDEDDEIKVAGSPTSSTSMGPEDNDLVITISKLRRKQKPMVPIVVHEHNEDLPCIPFPVKTFDDLYRLANHIQTDKVMFKDCQRLTPLMPALEELNAMIGLRSTKDALCNMILFELQNMPSYWRHIVITGAPGVGKTSIATIIAKILNRLGRTASDEITRGNPLNMIAQYEGQTPSEVNRVVQEALGKSGVLLIDEAPALNDKHNKDSYGKKCLDMLMQLMDQYRDRLIVIFAGYRRDMEVNILRSNDGFRRRIQWFFDMTDYTPEELHQIFLQKIKDTKFSLAPNTRFQVEWFREHYKDFPFFGGSVENFVHKVRIVHTRKTFGFPEKSVLPDDTIEEGFRMYLDFTIDPMKEEQRRTEASVRKVYWEFDGPEVVMDP